jgi:hypothetical protein
MKLRFVFENSLHDVGMILKHIFRITCHNIPS